MPSGGPDGDSASGPEPEVFKIGDTVEIHSLQGAKELNGRCGRVVKLIVEKARFGVKLTGEAGDPKALKASNLRKLDGVTALAAREVTRADQLLAAGQADKALQHYIAASEAIGNVGAAPRELRRGILGGKAHCHFLRREWWEAATASESACPYVTKQDAAVAVRAGRAFRELGLLHSAEEKFRKVLEQLTPDSLRTITAASRSVANTEDLKAADVTETSTEASLAEEAEECHAEVLAAMHALEDGAGEVIMGEIDRLRQALPEREAAQWMHTVKVKCQSDAGRQEMLGHGFLNAEWLDMPEPMYTARTMQKLLLYQVKKRLQQELSVMPGAQQFCNQYTFATPASLRHPEAPRLLPPVKLQELRDQGLAVVDEAFDHETMRSLRRECEMLDQMGILLQDDEDVCNPLQRRFDIPLDNHEQVKASRAHTPVLFNVIDRLRGLPALLEEHLGLQLRVPESVMLACYPKGAFYRKHLDSYEGKDIPRKVTILLYCNPEWTPEDGGCLKAWLGGDAVEFAPKSGRLIIFMAQDIWHEVTESKTERFAFTLWVWDVKKDDKGR